MKKIITAIIAASLSLFTLLSSLHAQEANVLAAAPKAPTPAPRTSLDITAHRVPASTKTAKELKKEAKEKKQFNRITRRFVDHFEDVGNITWTRQVDGYAGSFNRNGLNNTVWYNKDGNISYLMVTYFADRMPADLKRLVTKAHKGYNISVVQEIHHEDSVTYLVSLETDSHFKQVRICNGRMDIYQEFAKTQ